MTPNIQDIHMIPLPSELLEAILEKDSGMPVPDYCYLVIHGKRQVCIITTHAKGDNLLVLPIWLSMTDVPQAVIDEFYNPVLNLLIRLVCRHHYGQELKDDLPAFNKSEPENSKEVLNLFLDTGILPPGHEYYQKTGEEHGDKDQDTAPRV